MGKCDRCTRKLQFFFQSNFGSACYQHLCKFIGTRKSFYIRKEFNSHRIRLEHQYGRRDVMGKRFSRSDSTEGKLKAGIGFPFERCFR